jgi:hypothetical protein
MRSACRIGAMSSAASRPAALRGGPAACRAMRGALLASVLLAAAAAQAQTTAARPAARVTAASDGTQRSVLHGHLAPALRAARDRGRLAPQLDRGSPSYHRWLQPDDFGARFGVARARRA